MDLQTRKGCWRLFYLKRHFSSENGRNGLFDSSWLFTKI